MKKLILLAVGLTLIATPVFAGEYLINDTGQTAYGLRVTFSAPVMIKGFGDVLMTIEPTRESSTFTFSGGELEAWGGQWLVWTPSSTNIVSDEWLDSEGEAGGPELPTRDMPLTSCISWSALEDIAATILFASTPELYSYLTLDSCVTRTSDTPVSIPIYVSVPMLTLLEGVFEVCLPDGRCYPLSRVDPVSLYSVIEIPSVPMQLDLMVERNGEVVLVESVGVANRFQAITAGIQLRDAVESCSPVPPGFVKGVATRDCGNRFFYGVPGEGVFHRRDFIESTLQRIRLDGATDVYITSFFEFTEILPLPKIRTVPAEDGGCETLGEIDLQRIVDVSRMENLRVHVMYNGMIADSIGTSARNHLWSSSKRIILWGQTFILDSSLPCQHVSQ